MISSPTEKPTCPQDSQKAPPRRCLEIHTKRITTHKLLNELERRQEKGTYSVEMRQNIFYIYIDSNPVA